LCAYVCVCLRVCVFVCACAYACEKGRCAPPKDKTNAFICALVLTTDLCGGALEACLGLAMPQPTAFFLRLIILQDRLVQGFWL